MTNKNKNVDFMVTYTEEEENTGYSSRRSASRIAKQIGEFNADEISTAAADLVDRLSAAFKPKEGGPKETEIEIALSVSAEGKLIVAALGGAVTMKIKVKLDRT